MENLKKCKYQKTFDEINDWIRKNRDDKIFDVKLTYDIVNTIECLIEAINSHTDGKVIELDGLDSTEISIKFFRKNKTLLKRHELMVYIGLLTLSKQIYELYHYGDKIEDIPHLNPSCIKNHGGKKRKHNF